MELDPDIVKLFQNLLVSSSATATSVELKNSIKLGNKTVKKQQQQSRTHQHQQQPHPSFKTIPKFFQTLPASSDTLRQSLRKEAHSLYLQRRSHDLMDNDELNTLWSVLEQNASPTTTTTTTTMAHGHGQHQFISYDDFERIRTAVDERCRKYLTARIYAQLLCLSGYSNGGLVEISTLFNYIMRRVFMLQCRIGLSFYDSGGQGFLREIDFENYIIDMIPTLTQIKDALEPNFQAYYVCTVARKFFFFLDPLRTGRLRIRDILASGLITELLELRDERSGSGGCGGGDSGIASSASALCINNNNNNGDDSNAMSWFSMESVLTVYGSYLSLDKDHNGMLSKSELAGYGSGTLTTIFVERLFEECRTFDGEMDYKTFLDLVLALDNRHEPQSLSYIFRILDVHHLGYLTQQTLRYFYKGIEQQIAAHNIESVRFEDINDEIFDMVKPKDPYKITLQDLIDSGHAEIVVSILIEFQRFWAYENCENIRSTELN